MCLMSDASGYMGSPPGVHATVGEYKTTLLPSGSLLVKVGQARRQKLGWLLLGFAPFWREKLSFLKCKMCKTLWNEHWTCCIEILKIELELLQKPSWLLVFNPHCVLELLLKAWPLCTQVPDQILETEFWVKFCFARQTGTRWASAPRNYVSQPQRIRWWVHNSGSG